MVNFAYSFTLRIGIRVEPPPKILDSPVWVSACCASKNNYAKRIQGDLLSGSKGLGH